MRSNQSIIRKLFIAISTILIIGAIGVLAYFMIISNVQINWGHHFIFTNSLDKQIDSLTITVGDSSTTLISTPNLEGNIAVPEGGYPHKVSIKIYHTDGVEVLGADSFNCYNCDGSHEYILTPSGAEYRFLN
jgi:hypothetical protein